MTSLSTFFSSIADHYRSVTGESGNLSPLQIMNKTIDMAARGDAHLGYDYDEETDTRYVCIVEED